MKRLLLLALVACLASCGGGDDLRGDVLLTADRLFDGRELHEPGAVLVRGGQIVAVGGDLDAEAGRTIELGDATILPGFIDLHVHRYDGMLRGGVTTVRNVGSAIGNLRPAGRYGGLRILMAGPIMSVPGGYPETMWGPAIALNVSSPGEARAAVRRLAEGGAAVIKISLEPAGNWPMLTVAEVRALVDEAHANDLEVTAHAQRSEGVRRAIAGGVDELAHAPCGATDEQLLRLVERKIEVVATLHVLQLTTGGCAEVAARLHELGGRLLYGSDVGVPEIPAGIDVEELRLLREAGMTPVEVLASGTSEAGAELGLEPLGTLAKGAPADVIAVRGDALALADDLADPLVVLSGGRLTVAPR